MRKIQNKPRKDSSKECNLHTRSKKHLQDIETTNAAALNQNATQTE